MTAAARAFRVVMALVAATVAVAWTAAPAAADSVRDKQWHLDALDIGKAHRITRGAGVTVALIDTGVAAEHRDLAASVRPGIDLLPRPLGDGRQDIAGHGTQMAGVIAGRGHGSGDGVLGIAPQADILPIRAPTNATTTHDYMTRAVAFAREQGADVINMSFGGSDDAILHDAIRSAQAADIVLVASSGNIGGRGGDFPGGYPEVLTVGALDRDGAIADFSVTGPQVDLTAPGVDIVTTGISGSTYYRGSGTSEACAIVSGAAALVRARFPDLSAAEVVHRLTATATDAGPRGRDDSYGYGRLDLVQALTAEVPAVATAPDQPSDAPAAAAPQQRALPERVSPLVVTGIAAAGVLVVGGVLVAVLLRRRS
ncbi:type VII secretion-associated serine protease mycosin [Actinoplanes sp. N902-109]|uniref:type VII secretion-associated serine protease mycosin n=1 Tax=Actinoplanes sp. (strain N902-109) TaxID=649831 RepID=UPI0003294596|nr:type VII secretion-associated serine protease mycosin [Actinoplanes sp. N902-109]AGL15219.1 peptidase S8/S53 subtilisin kexin sedolisin [Actinoplanes sp. N902-109]